MKCGGIVLCRTIGIPLVLASLCLYKPTYAQPALPPSALSPTANAPSVASSGSSGASLQRFPLQPYLNGTVFDEQPLQNITYRFIGAQLYNANATFQGVIANVIATLAPDSQCNVTYRPGYEAPIYGPDGVNGSRIAYAPTPGQVPLNFGRKLKQNLPFNEDTFKNRNTAYTTIDVNILFLGNSSSSILQLTRPELWNGYLAVQFEQQGITISPMPINISTTSNILNITNTMPLTPIYVLGTILKISGSDLWPINTQAQNTLYLALNTIFGNQPSFLFNFFQKVWQDSANGFVRVGLLTYTTVSVNSLNEIAGGDVAALMSQIAQSVAANFTVTIIHSQALGTQAQELAGAPGFDLDVNSAYSTPANVTSSSGHHLSSGVIGGIVGAVIAVVLAVAVLASLVILSRRRTQRKKASAKESKSDALSKTMEPILNSDPTSSSGYTATSSGNRSLSQPNSASLNTPTAQQQHPLSEAWNINPDELAVCQMSNGADWLLGTGSFGQVFRGLRGGVQDVAIKQLIKPGNSHLRMFEKEVALLRHLNFDRNLVQFYGACIADGNLMLVLEYMDGGDLKEALGNDSEGKLGWYQRGGHVLCDIARGLHFLHSNKVAHRDLKTKNILMTRSGVAKIGDVGLAKLVGSQLLSTQLDTAGTFAYAAPELLMGEPCDTRADLFSFGVIMWEIITHEIPVRGNLRGLVIPEEAPPEVARVIERCLQRNPADRPSAKDVFDQLRGLLPASTGPKPALVNTARSGSLPAVAETEELLTRSSDQSGVGSDIMEFEAEFHRPQKGEDYSASNEGSSSSLRQLSDSQQSTLTARDGR